jgi:D-beta-D-heptose 7-phosphate kinase/D-beta-D-heptose 1-phosphate adenosyltransferase
MTQGGNGLTVVQGDAQATHLDTDNRDVFDVTGAGETVLAAGTCGLLLQLTPQETGELANIAAGLTVSRPGLASLTPQDIERAIWLREARVQAEKVVSLDTLRDIVLRAQHAGHRVVWTNGCYDLVHAGHILYLERARALGDILVVGLNSDRSVRLSKGAGRPIVTETQRAKLISSLNVVDYVIVFDDESPRDIIRELKPDIYAKGGDYTVDTINQDERHIVEEYGGEIALLPGVEGMSTTHLIEKILKTYRDD